MSSLGARLETDFAGSQQFEQHKKFCKGTQAKIPPCQCGKVWTAADDVETHRASCFVYKALKPLSGQQKISNFFGVKPAQPQPLDGDDATASAEPQRTICQGWRAVEWPQALNRRDTAFILGYRQQLLDSSPGWLFSPN